jgi:alanyl-tRNA synthetase
MILGDAVLLWNTADPARLASDIGCGLERIRWALTRNEWTDVVYGRPLCDTAPSKTLDALRTATLIVGSGITPTHRGPGSIVRRLLRASVTSAGTLGLSRVVRWAHAYWSLVCPLRVPWPEVCRVIETETDRYAR